MGKECGARFSRRLWGGSNTSPRKTTAWEASGRPAWEANAQSLEAGISKSRNLYKEEFLKAGNLKMGISLKGNFYIKNL